MKRMRRTQAGRRFCSKRRMVHRSGSVGALKGADVARQDLPDHLVQAVISTEDRRFYSHFGIDPFGILRAARRNLSVGEVVEGGSTITQQLVKNRSIWATTAPLHASCARR